MAFTTKKMALRVWNLLSDPYDHDQLATNWVKVDLHDHTFGRGVQIPTDGIADGAVTSAKLAPGASQIQAGSVNAEKFATLPATRVFNGSVISLTNGTDTLLTFNSERYDTDGIHDTTTNTGRLTCKTAGLYAISANVGFNTNTTGFRYVYIRVNGSPIIAFDSRSPVSGYPTHVNLATQYRLAVNDYVEVIAHQTSGAALDVLSTAQYTPEFAMAWLSP